MEQRENQFIKFPIKLEQYLMEGTYRHIEEAQKQVPAASYSYFVTKLSGTVRDSIADRFLLAGTCLPLLQLIQMLHSVSLKKRARFVT